MFSLHYPQNTLFPLASHQAVGHTQGVKDNNPNRTDWATNHYGEAPDGVSRADFSFLSLRKVKSVGP